MTLKSLKLFFLGYSTVKVLQKCNLNEKRHLRIQIFKRHLLRKPPNHIYNLSIYEKVPSLGDKRKNPDRLRNNIHNFFIFYVEKRTFFSFFIHKKIVFSFKKTHQVFAQNFKQLNCNIHGNISQIEFRKVKLLNEKKNFFFHQPKCVWTNLRNFCNLS